MILAMLKKLIALVVLIIAFVAGGYYVVTRVIP